MRRRRSSFRKEKAIMLASSCLVLTALTVTGLYVRNQRKELPEENVVDFTALEEEESLTMLGSRTGDGAQDGENVPSGGQGEGTAADPDRTDFSDALSQSRTGRRTRLSCPEPANRRTRLSLLERTGRRTRLSWPEPENRRTRLNWLGRTNRLRRLRRRRRLLRTAVPPGKRLPPALPTPLQERPLRRERIRTP